MSEGLKRGLPSDHAQAIREAVAWPIARFFWTLRLDRIGNHFEDVAWCGKQWLGISFDGEGVTGILVALTCMALAISVGVVVILLTVWAASS